jgi:excisionase family DNA binding protein
VQPVSPSPDADLTGVLASTVKSTLNDRLDRLEELFEATRDREAFTTHQAAKRLGKSAWTVRRWAELGQIKAQKVLMGRTGRKGEWRISEEEVTRIEREGPQAENTYSN